MTAHRLPLRIPALYMRGGTSKGVFFQAKDLPTDPATRDRLLLRAIGSPDPYGKQIDGLGGATSSTSKVVIVSPSTWPDCDVDYLFGAVAIDRPVIDWSGNCGNLSAAVGPFALQTGLVPLPTDGWATVRIWQANIGQRIVAHVPVQDGQVLESGEFELDGVASPGAEVRLEFLELDPERDVDPTPQTSPPPRGLFPTGRTIDTLDVPGVGRMEATLIQAGNPTIFVRAEALGLSGTELQPDVNGRPDLLARVEAVRAAGAVAMGLARTAEEASTLRPHTPKLAFVAEPVTYTASDGRTVHAQDIDLLARIFSMGPLHHAMTGTGAVAIAAASALPGTLVHRIAPMDPTTGRVRFGHPSGRLSVGAEVHPTDGGWTLTRVRMSRTARCLMEGWVRVPGDTV